MNRLDFPADDAHTYQPDLLQRWQTTFIAIALSLVVYYGWPYIAYETAIKRMLYNSAQSVLPTRLLKVLQRHAILPPNEIFQNAQSAGPIKQLYNDSGVATVVQRARRLSGLDKLIPASELTFSGLHNWDNSCFQNSVLQGLASLDAFREFVHTGAQKCSTVNVACSTQEALDSFMAQLHQESAGKNTLWPPAALRTMNTWHQQDAQEYFSKIMEVVEKEAMKYVKCMSKSRTSSLASLRALMSEMRQKDAEDTPIDRGGSLPQSSGLFPPNPLEGLLSESLRCQKCQFSEGLSLMPFNFVTLNLGLENGYYVEELLDAYTDPELIEGVDCDKCTQLAQNESEDSTEAISDETQQNPKIPKVKSTKAKQSLFARLPENLVLHINRSIFDDYGNQRKNTATVRFPAILEIVDDWIESPISDGDNTVHAYYELRCVVTHQGRHDNGHYVACGKRGKFWYSFNDEIVTRISEADVLSKGNVFMLFYERNVTPPVLELPVIESEASEAEDK